MFREPRPLGRQSTGFRAQPVWVLRRIPRGRSAWRGTARRYELLINLTRYARDSRPHIAAFRRHPSIVARARSLAAHGDPLAETNNWVALAIGSHLPLWPFYILFTTGRQAWPTALMTAALAPFLLAVPILCRHSSLLGRIAMPMLGVAKTVFTVWVLGVNSGTEVFLFPCAALAALSFRKSERWLMVVVATLPLAVWCLLQQHPPVPMHRYDPAAADRLFELNVFSIAVIVLLLGWLQAEIYHRLEMHQ